MTRDFAGKCVLITGAGSGIGRETAYSFAHAGATLELVDIDDAGLERTALLCRHLGAEVKTHVVDVTWTQAMKALADDVHSRHAAVDVLFNNAGVGCEGDFVSTELGTFDWAYSINVKGVIHGCHFFVPKMIERGRGGHVLNMSSGSGLAAGKNMSVYAMTKFAVTGISEVLREELAPHHIHVTTVCPGVINTPIVANARRSGQPSTDSGHPERAEKIYQRRAYGPELVAEVIIDAVRKDHGGVLPVSPEAWFVYLGKRFVPGLVRKVLNMDPPAEGQLGATSPRV